LIQRVDIESFTKIDGINVTKANELYEIFGQAVKKFADSLVSLNSAKRTKKTRLTTKSATKWGGNTTAKSVTRRKSNRTALSSDEKPIYEMFHNFGMSIQKIASIKSTSLGYVKSTSKTSLQ
jgi:hypothetical protein